MSDVEEIQRADLRHILNKYVNYGYLDIKNKNIYNLSIEELEQLLVIAKIGQEDKEREQLLQQQKELKTHIKKLLTNGELKHYIDIVLAEIKPEHDYDGALNYLSELIANSYVSSSSNKHQTPDVDDFIKIYIKEDKVEIAKKSMIELGLKFSEIMYFQILTGLK